MLILDIVVVVEQYLLKMITFLLIMWISVRILFLPRIENLLWQFSGGGNIQEKSSSAINL